jgi:hypothetical protein
MHTRRAAVALLFAALFGQFAVAQEPTPSFTLAPAPSTPPCVNPQQYYSCNATVDIGNWQASPDYGVCGQLECHLEYCFGQTLNAGGTAVAGCQSPNQQPSYSTGWKNHRPTSYTFTNTTNGSGSFTLYGEYAVVAGGGIT